MSELKECPFCGSKDVKSYYRDMDDRFNSYDPIVMCHGCRMEWRFAGMKRYTGTLKDVEEAWNRRVKE